MNATTPRIGFGGGCHWCTEAVFQHVPGVTHVDQGWASDADDPERYSEAVLVDYDLEQVSLAHLVRVHLHTHSCTSDHPMRRKYRSAVYGFGESEMEAARAAIEKWRSDFDAPVLTEVLRLGGFRQNTERYRDYYRKDPEAPFCRRWVEPKLLTVKAFGEGGRHGRRDGRFRLPSGVLPRSAV